MWRAVRLPRLSDGVIFGFGSIGGIARGGFLSIIYGGVHLLGLIEALRRSIGRGLLLIRRTEALRRSGTLLGTLGRAGLAVHLERGLIGIHRHAGRRQKIHAHAGGKAGHGAAEGEAGAVEGIHIAANFSLIGNAVHYRDYTVVVAQHADGIAAITDAAHVGHAGLGHCSRLLGLGSSAGERHHGADVIGLLRLLGRIALLGHLLLMLGRAAVARHNIRFARSLLGLGRTVALLEEGLRVLLLRLLGLGRIALLRITLLGRLRVSGLSVALGLLISRLTIALRLLVGGLLVSRLIVTLLLIGGIRLRGDGRFCVGCGRFFPGVLRLIGVAGTVEERVVSTEKALGALHNILESHVILLCGYKGRKAVHDEGKCVQKSISVRNLHYIPKKAVLQLFRQREGVKIRIRERWSPQTECCQGRE